MSGCDVHAAKHFKRTRCTGSQPHNGNSKRNGCSACAQLQIVSWAQQGEGSRHGCQVGHQDIERGTLPRWAEPYEYAPQSNVGRQRSGGNGRRGSHGRHGGQHSRTRTTRLTCCR